MTSRELMDRFFANSHVLNSREFRLFSRLLLHHIAEHAHELRLVDGQKLNDGSDFSAGLRELAEATRISEGEVYSGPERRSLPNVTLRQEQPRWKITCVKCSHVHEKDGECGVNLGKGGFCDCKAEVVA